MKKLNALALIAVLLPAVVRADADAASQAIFDRLMKAVETNDYPQMVTQAMDEFKKGLTPELLKSVSKDLGPHLTAGYSATYFGDLHQRGFTTHLWKLVFKDGRDDALIRISEKGGLVAGFFIQ